MRCLLLQFCWSQLQREMLTPPPQLLLRMTTNEWWWWPTCTRVAARMHSHWQLLLSYWQRLPTAG